MATIKRCNISQSQVEQELDQVIQSADSVRVASLQKLLRIRAIRTKNQERERLRLAEKLGDNHPRVIALQAKIDAAYEFARNLQVETIRAQTEAPVVDKENWVVHGRVFADQQEPVSGMKVVLYDRSDCPLQACESGYTDKTGYFKLTVKNVADETRETASTGKQAEAFVHVIDTNNVTVHRDRRPLPVKAGQVQYIEILLNDGDLPGRPPQPKTRYLGNSKSKEIHDLKNRKPACQIDEIKADHRVNFKTRKEALELGYDFCPYCSGKDKSKR